MQQIAPEWRNLRKNLAKRASNTELYCVKIPEYDLDVPAIAEYQAAMKAAGLTRRFTAPLGTRIICRP